MTEYNFGGACGAIYDFFLHELCDYYLELLKPLMGVSQADVTAAIVAAAAPGGAPLPAPIAAAIAAASAAGGDVARAQALGRSTLRVCLELGFRLPHPMMPFVTEELWQRLPGRGLPSRALGSAGGVSTPDPASIMIAPYPQPLPTLNAPTIESDFSVFQAILKAGRALRADADIIPSKFAAFSISVSDDDTRRIVTAQHSDLTSMLRASELNVVSTTTDVPRGCVASVISDTVSIHMQLLGLVDPAAEAAKLAKRITKVNAELEAIRKRTLAPGYAEKVPADVQAANAEAVAGLERQLTVMAALAESYKEGAAAGATA